MFFLSVLSNSAIFATGTIKPRGYVYRKTDRRIALNPETGANHFGKKQLGEIAGSKLTLKLSSEGFSWNGNLMPSDIVWDNDKHDYNLVIPALASRNTLYVGAVEGSHLTRALYHYIRVVRVKDPAETPVPRD